METTMFLTIQVGSKEDDHEGQHGDKDTKEGSRQHDKINEHEKGRHTKKVHA